MKKLSTIQKITVAFVMAITLAIPVALAQTSGSGEGAEGAKRADRRGHRRGGFGREGRLFSQLGLTDAQKEQMKQIREANRQRLEPLHQELRTKRQELRQLSQAGTFDEAAVRAKLVEMAGIEAKLMGERARIRQETLAVLTPEQKTKMEQLRAEFEARRAERRARKSPRNQ